MPTEVGKRCDCASGRGLIQAAGLHFNACGAPVQAQDRILLNATRQTAYYFSYGHLIPGAGVSYVDRLELKSEKKGSPARQPSATPAQPRKIAEAVTPSYVVDFIGGGRQDRTADLRVMNPSL